MIDKTSTALIVALISILGLTSCIRYNVAEPLDRFSSPEMGTADGNEITVTAGSTWFAEGEYENFILTGQALTGENAEAALLFHHTDGKSGYEVAFRNGAIDGTRKSGSLTSVRNLYRSLAEDGKWFDFEIAVRGHNIMIAINDTVVVCPGCIFPGFDVSVVIKVNLLYGILIIISIYSRIITKCIR